MYQELTYQIRMHANDFRKAGIEQDALMQMVGNVSVRMDTDFSDNDRENYADLVIAIRDNIQKAGNAINTAYDRREE